MIRSPELRDAYDMVKADKKAQRTARKEAARQHIRAIVATKAPGQRQPRERNNGYLAWIRRLPCIACVIEGSNCGPVEAAHLRHSDASRGRINSGMQAKPDDKWCTPLGTGHHQHNQHKGNERAFWDRLGVDAGDLCEALYAAFLAGQDGEPVVRRFARVGVDR